MSNVIGTIVSVNEFLNNNKIDIYVRDKKGDSCTVFTLKDSRKYIIPAYQRELRWNEKQIHELIYDIVNGKLFLGNFIISEKTVGEINEYEIIDGQQRITSLRMIVKYIFENYTNPSAISKYDLCTLEVKSFKDFTELEKKSFIASEAEKEKFSITDDYHQIDSYMKLWEIISKCSLLKTNEQKRVFLTKLDSCYINLIILDKREVKLGIEYFVDVNQKGVRLDSEDTLKGYLFQYNSNEMNNLWTDIKKLCFTITEDYKCKYSLLLLFEQYFYCTLYKDEKFKNISLKQDFTLKEDFIIKGLNGEKEGEFSKGTHLIQVLRDNRDVLNDVKKIKDIGYLILEIIKEPHITQEFKKYINPYVLTGDGKIVDDDLQCMYYMLRQILLDSNEVPKALVIKYISDILLNKELSKKMIETTAEKKKIKQTYQSVYTMYILYILFALFVGKKNKEKLYNVFKDGDFQELMTKVIISILSEDKIVDNMKSISYKTFTKSSQLDPRKDAYRCKAIATLYNFMYYDSNRKIYSFNKHGELSNFLNKTDEFSLEHFLLNSKLKSRIYLGSPDETVPYENNILKFVGSMFNFIFIHDKINNTILDNRCLFEKIEILKKDGQAFEMLTEKQKEIVNKYDINCNYSKMALNLFYENKCFSKYIDICKQKDGKSLSDYFSKHFTEEYSDYIDLLTSSFLKQITQHHNK